MRIGIKNMKTNKARPYKKAVGTNSKRKRRQRPERRGAQGSKSTQTKNKPQSKLVSHIQNTKARALRAPTHQQPGSGHRLCPCRPLRKSSRRSCFTLTLLAFACAAAHCITLTFPLPLGFTNLVLMDGRPNMQGSGRCPQKATTL